MLFISIVLPAYKRTFLKQAIESILNQTYTNFELIIVNDDSPENLDDIIHYYKDKRIRYYKNPENIGKRNLVEQWNHCIDFAKGDYIVLAADDDLYHPDFLRTCVRLAEKYPLVNLIRSRVEQIDEKNILVGIDAILPEYCSKYEFLYYWMSGTSFTCIGNYMFKAPVLKERRFIDFPCAFGSDTASAVMMSDCGVANTKEMLFSFRFSSIHLSGSNLHYKEKLKANTMLFSWLAKMNYNKPENKYDIFFSSFIDNSKLYAKCKYDYYNLVIKNLPLHKFYYIRYCDLLSFKDKSTMFFRFYFNKIIRKK